MAQEQQDVDTLKRRGRRRLVGAVALVLLAVIVLPMVFDQEPRQSAPQISVRVPGEDETPFKPKAAAPKKVDKAEKKQETAKTEEFIVPVGAFSNAEGVVAKLKAAKVPHYTEPVQGNLTRVRAGPFPTKDAAEKALQKLRGLGLEPGAVAPRTG
jgi:DedD protein